MKTAPRARPLAIALIVALGVAATAGCERRLDNAKAPRENVASTTVTTTTTTNMPASGNLIGTPPAPPTRPEGAPPETTPVTAESQAAAQNAGASQPGATEGTRELTRSEEQKAMPLPGQPNDHSNLASDGSQRAGQTDPQSMPPRTDLAPNPPQRRTQPD